MPKNIQRKTKVKSKRTTQPKEVKQKEVKQKTSFLDVLKFGESYTSLILGIIFVVIATIILLTFVKGKNTAFNMDDIRQELALQATATPEVTKKLISDEQKNIPTVTTAVEPTKAKQADTVTGSTYIVKKDDTLWKIAESKYKSGYNWVDIQKANNITNPSILHAGTKLILPSVEPKIATAVVTVNTEKQKTTMSSIQTNKISGASYTIAKGDTLWDIAVRAYGDGYAWTKIAKANNLNNASTIHVGNKLTIPR